MTDRALRARGVGVRHGQARLLDSVDLAVDPGEWLGVIGPNGAGKSTLLRVLAGLIRHDGAVTLGGRAPKVTEVALMPQRPVLPAGMTVAEYVLLGRSAHLGWLRREGRQDREITASVLRRLGLATLADRTVSTLSGGESQRVALARALAQEATVLLLDEPTSALDLGHEVGVLALVDELRCVDGLVIVSVLHDLSAAAVHCDRLLLLDHGRPAAYGTPAEVLTDERLSRTYRTPLTVHEVADRLVITPGHPGFVTSPHPPHDRTTT